MYYKRRSTRYYSDKQEKRVASAVNGQQTSNSGATHFSKGDVRTSNFLIECKTKVNDSNSITMKREWFEKLKEEAFAMGKAYTALAFDFGDGETKYVIDEKLFQLLLDYMEKSVL